MLMQHSPERPIGRMQKFNEEKDGIYASFKISASMQGQDALILVLYLVQTFVLNNMQVPISYMVKIYMEHGSYGVGVGTQTPFDIIVSSKSGYSENVGLGPKKSQVPPKLVDKHQFKLL